jgi:uncharacterized protein YycO
MKQIRIIFSRSNQIGSIFLQWHQRCKYSHVEVIDDNNEIIGARLSGVKYYDIKKLKSGDHIICTLEVTDVEYELFFGFLRDKIGDKYDWLAYLGFMFNSMSYEKKDKWFCSELIYKALQYAGVHLYQNLDSWKVMPRDLYIHKDIIKFQG